jgi:hypothetical protein
MAAQGKPKRRARAVHLPKSRGQASDWKNHRCKKKMIKNELFWQRRVVQNTREENVLAGDKWGICLAVALLAFVLAHDCPKQKKKQIREIEAFSFLLSRKTCLFAAALVSVRGWASLAHREVRLRHNGPSAVQNDDDTTVYGLAEPLD